MKSFGPTAAAAGVLVAAAAGGMLLTVPQPVSAATTPRPPKPIVCQSLTQAGPNADMALNGCNRRGITGRSGTQTSCPTGSSTCITWATGKTIDYTSSFTVPSNSRCGGAGFVEVDVVGNVVSGTGAGTKRLIGATVIYDACVTQQITVVTVGLVPGTTFTIGS
jgi:hypothetical protein